ncbi:MAG: hypothetical protein IJR61_04690, partial [Clostridia bacterium]|nr:hypothetical protein [Clostridia bacterium]
MKKIINATFVFLIAITFGISLFTGNAVKASAAVEVRPAVTNEYSGKERFTKVPAGVAVADFASGVWNDMPEYSCNNIVLGKNLNGKTYCTYKLMWNDEKLFFVITARDTTWNDDDMIEIGIRYKNQNWGYLFATLAPWVGAGQFGNGGMTFVDFKADTETKVRSICFTADLKDKTVLKNGESLLMNVNYYDYAPRVNDEKRLICRLQSGVAASGDPCQFFPIVAAGSQDSETPDTTLYNEVYAAYGDETNTDSSDNISDSEAVTASEKSSSGCMGGVSASAAGFVAILL